MPYFWCLATVDKKGEKKRLGLRKRSPLGNSQRERPCFDDRGGGEGMLTAQRNTPTLDSESPKGVTRSGGGMSRLPFCAHSLCCARRLWSGFYTTFHRRLQSKKWSTRRVCQTLSARPLSDTFGADNQPNLLSQCQKLLLTLSAISQRNQANADAMVWTQVRSVCGGSL